ncbi:MAG TPA: bifunctional UDP-sugar hydrolase/5'-nucleotidase [Terriglobia bacterium]|nr:bifunctional UDP-sugar hydrolase/5'-nucleotidase [Terriglobia bacterium]
MLRTIRGAGLLIVAASLGVAAQAPTRVTIMHTNDLHGQIGPRNGQGGLAEIATIMRAGRPDLLLDAGDLFTGTYVDDRFEGRPTILAMNAIGYTAGTIGNHEFDYGQSVLADRIREAKFPLLSANLESAIPGIRPFVVVRVKGIRIGLIGLTTADVRTTTHPRNLAGIRVREAVETLHEVLPEVRARADFVIVMAHLTDEEERRVAAAFPEIRLIIGGHNHSVVGPVQRGETLIAKTGSIGRNVGQIDLEFQGTRMTRMDARLIPVRGRPNREVASLLEPFTQAVAKTLAGIVGESTADLAKSDRAESALANIVADAYRARATTQIGIANLGGIRGSIPRGPIQWNTLFEVFPFRDTLVTLKLTGAQLKKTLGVRLVAISGARARYDLTKASGDRLIAATLSNGDPIMDTRIYSVATNDFLVAGGDGFGELGRGTDISDTGIPVRDVLTDYVRNQRTLRPGLDGRIVVERAP